MQTLRLVVCDSEHCQGRSLRGPSLLHRSPILSIEQFLRAVQDLQAFWRQKRLALLALQGIWIKHWSQGLHVPESRKEWREPGLAVGLSTMASMHLGGAASNQTCPYVPMYFQHLPAFRSQLASMRSNWGLLHCHWKWHKEFGGSSGWPRWTRCQWCRVQDAVSYSFMFLARVDRKIPHGFGRQTSLRVCSIAAGKEPLCQ